MRIKFDAINGPKHVYVGSANKKKSKSFLHIIFFQVKVSRGVGGGGGGDSK